MHMARPAFLVIVICFLLVSTTMPVHAQVVQQYLQDKSLTASHLTVSIEGQEDAQQSWWKKMWRYLGIRSSVYMRPKVGTRIIVNSSAYASSPYQTDSTPCITASGERVGPGVVATNFLPLGTIVSINGKKHKVADRMNPRFAGYYMDIWFPSTSEALEFGRKKVEITIVDYAAPGKSIEDPTPPPTPEVTKKQEKKSVIKSISESVTAIGNLLITKTYRDVNRYDVDCTK